MELSHATKWAWTAGGVFLSELYLLLCRLQQGWSLHQVLCYWLADELLSISLQRLVQHLASHQKDLGVSGWWLHHWWWRDNWVHCQSVQPIFQESSLCQWSVLNLLNWGGWWFWAGGHIDFFQAVIKVLHVVPICKALDLISFVAQPWILHLAQL